MDWTIIALGLALAGALKLLFDLNVRLSAVESELAKIKGIPQLGYMLAKVEEAEARRPA